MAGDTMAMTMGVAAEPVEAAQAAPAAPLFAMSGIAKRFGKVQALADIDLDVRAGEVHCLLGENGAGKSTLCNLIFGVHQPSQGVMTFAGQPYLPADPAAALEAGVAMVHQHFSLVPTMSVVENLMLGQAKGVLKTQQYAEQMVAVAAEFGMSIDPHRLVSDLSVGERQRVEIVKCLMRRPRLLLLDEPTAVLPPEEIGALLDVCRKVAEAGRAVVLVTHKLAEIARVADRTTVLRGGRVVETAEMKGADLGNLVRAMVGRELKSLDGGLAASLGMAPPLPAQLARKDDGSIDDTAAAALYADGVTVRDRTGVERLSGFTLLVQPGEIVGVAGVEGNGQTELGAVLAGLASPVEGRLFIGATEITRASPAAITAAGAGIVPEDRHAVACITPMSVAENMFLNTLDRFTRFGLVRRGAMNEAAKDLMGRFDVRAAGPEAPMSSLSGGNQQKAVLARELTLDKLMFLLAAQPTRGLDVGAVEAVYRAIRDAAQRGIGVLLISSELDDLIAVSHRIVVLYRGRIVGEMPADPKNRETIGHLMSGGTA